MWHWWTFQKCKNIEGKTSRDHCVKVVHSFARTAMAWYHRLSGFNSRNLLSHNLVDWRPRSRCQQVWFLMRPLFLAGRWLSSSCLKWDFLYVNVLGVSPFSYKDTSHIELGSFLMISFTSLLLWKVLSVNILKYLGLVLQYINTGRHNLV